MRVGENLGEEDEPLRRDGVWSENGASPVEEVERRERFRLCLEDDFADFGGANMGEEVGVFGRERGRVAVEAVEDEGHDGGARVEGWREERGERRRMRVLGRS